MRGSKTLCTALLAASLYSAGCEERDPNETILCDLSAPEEADIQASLTVSALNTDDGIDEVIIYENEQMLFKSECMGQKSCTVIKAIHHYDHVTNSYHAMCYSPGGDYNISDTLDVEFNPEEE